MDPFDDLKTIITYVPLRDNIPNKFLTTLGKKTFLN